MSLFSDDENIKINDADISKPIEPLAVLMRPKHIDELVGQEHITKNESFFRKMLESDNIISLLFFGPPGSGKTTLAEIIKRSTKMHFCALNAVSSGVNDLKKVVEEAKKRFSMYRIRTILFIDEIHRYNKSQQDFLLPFVENGTIILIGATTENPYFEMNTPLLSRIKILTLDSLKTSDIVKILKKALNTEVPKLTGKTITASEEVLEAIATVAAGDVRSALNILEQSSFLNLEDNKLSLDNIKNISEEKIFKYDKKGDNHYNVISAFIKSMRGSDPDAAVHYLARMLESGEDINFIARRMLIFSSEDVGNADPNALILTNAAASAVKHVGMPEAKIILSQAATYLASAPKSNSSYLAIKSALNDLKTIDCGEVPFHLRNLNEKTAKLFNTNAKYLYPHDYPGNHVIQQYLPDKIKEATYYKPSNNGYEKEISEKLKDLKHKKNHQ
ncbi:replication-associated recombination protein A [Selenomonadales bacterium OttesenSCG-928-I06]|nr:replication-associated recombination protein A [Selenomonadales bacterium OttesenSCG-928-I06]